jgi:Holliday junction resolvase
MKRKNSRTKGAVGERELSELFRRFGYTTARRGQQRSGVDQADVIGGPEGWHFECKRTEKLKLREAFEQAERDAPDDEEPVVAWRSNRLSWLAVIRLETFLDFLRSHDDLLAASVKHNVAALEAQSQAAAKSYKARKPRKPPSVTEPVIDVEEERTDLREDFGLRELRETLAHDPAAVMAANPPAALAQAPGPADSVHGRVLSRTMLDAPGPTVMVSPDDLPDVDSIPRVVEGAEGVQALRAKFAKEKADADKFLAEVLRGT